MSSHLRQATLPLFLLACLLLGGSPQGIWRNALLQVAGAGLLLWVLLSPSRAQAAHGGRLLLWLAGLWFALLLVQLLPLPPSLWTLLPSRELAVEAFTLRGEPLPWLPLSLTPTDTAETLPVMLVPLAVLGAMLVAGAAATRWCVAALLLGTFVSVILAVVQVAQGGPYLYPIHNSGASGLFANSNHQATLLLVTFPFLAALIGGERDREEKRAAGKGGAGRLLIGLAGVALVMFGVALNGSLAGLLLLAPVGLASLALALPRWPRLGRPFALATLPLLIGGVVLLAVTSGAGTSDTGFTSRAEIFQRTAAAVAESFPAGTGIGSFEEVYRQYEEAAAVDRTYVNAAHSDPLQWLLEAGLPGALLLLLLLGWWLRRASALWIGVRTDPMARAATIASAAILAHSLVDYPLRDPAIQALFALCLALMADKRRHQPAPGAPDNGRAPRHLGIRDGQVVILSE